MYTERQEQAAIQKGNPALDLSIVVVNWKTLDRLQQCLESVHVSATGLSFEVWGVDNGSTGGSAELVAERFPEVRLLRNKDNVGFVRANSQAIDLSVGP